MPSSNPHSSRGYSTAQFSSVAQSRPILCNLVDCSMPGFPFHHKLPELAQTHIRLVSMSSNHLILCHPLLLMPSIFPSIRDFSKDTVLRIRWTKYGVLISASVLSMNFQDWFPLEFTGLILKSKGLPRVFSNTRAQKHEFFSAQISLWSNSHIHTWLLEKKIALTRQTFVSKVMFLLFNMLSRLVIAFLPRSKHLLISWLWSASAVILEPPKIKSLTVSIVSPSFAMKWWKWMPWSSFFECWVLSQLFHFPLSLSSRGSLVPLHFLP